MIKEALKEINEALELIPVAEIKKARKEMEKELKFQKYDLKDNENREHMLSILYFTICHYAKIETDGGETRLISFIDKKYGSSNPFDEKTTLHLEDIAKPYAKKVTFDGKEIDDDQWSELMGIWYPAFGMKW